MQAIRVGSLVAVIGLFLAANVRADEPPKLEYRVGDGVTSCPSEPEFRDAVAARLGRDPFVAESRRRLVVEVRVEDNELSATGALVDADGVSAGLRRITGEPANCHEVVEGMALAVSLALSAALGELGAPFTPANENEPKLETTPSEKPPERASRAPRVDRAVRKSGASTTSAGRLELGGGLVGHAAIGVGPGVGAGGSILVTGRFLPWSLALEGRFDGFSSGMTFERGGSATTRLLAGAVAPCWHFRAALACAVGLLGRIEAESTGVSSPDSDDALYSAAGARFGVEWPWSSAISVQGRFDLLVTLLPVDIELGNDVVWASPPVSGLLGAGLVGLFP